MSASSISEPSSENVARDVLESLHEGCQVISPDFRYVYVNATVAAQAHTTQEELVGRTMTERFPGIDQTPMFAVLRRCMSERAHDVMENEFAYPDGSKGWFELRFVPVPEGVCILSLDVTEKKRAQIALERSEEQLRHAQKMDAIGQLAGGLAHDFNNLLSIVVSYADLMIGELRPDDPMRADAMEIRTAGMRAADLTKQLLAFSRRQLLSLSIVDLNETLKQMGRMLERIIGEHIELRIAPGAGLQKVKVDPAQVEQVIMNLAINARDAMPNGGRLTIETGNAELDATYALAHAGVTAGPHVMLAVTDSGAGMDKATQERIFEPFFTTKEPGKGTGLGLSTVYGIVKQSGGNIWVYSEVGKGTTFKVYFPRTDESTDTTPPPPVATSLRGTETVLLVEDEPQVRVLVRTILTRHGYQVLEAESGDEALKFCQRYSGPIHLLLTDVVMPKMSGKQLAELLAPLRSQMKVLYMSGYTDNTVVHHGVLDEGIDFLQKPITPEALTRKVREVLDTKR
ncbi:MAG TPA: ATP-binding protein [Labilithrix sp.]|jgi:PAS domain S-box-containing protein